MDFRLEYAGDIIFVLRTTKTGFLNRRAIYRSVTAEHTTICFLWLQQTVAIFTFIEKQAGVGGHDFFLAVFTYRTCDHRF
jgi:hypothetical protein